MKAKGTDPGRVVPAMECIIDQSPSWLRKGRVGLLVNQASVNGGLNNTVDRLMSLFSQSIRLLLSPQHGIWGDKQANMVPSEDELHPRWGIPIYSLYGKRRWPTEEILEQIDLLLVDLQEVGCRVYTFLSTLHFCLQKAAEMGKKVIVADRPNPLGGLEVEGNLLEDPFRSIVGPSIIPMRHGMTIGELALLFNGTDGIGCDLEVVKMKGWKRSMLHTETGLPWVPPSPNMPRFKTSLVYPGQVLLEGTNLSEGRGTTMPFELFGAPFIDPFLLKDSLSKFDLPGVFLREVFFEPWFDKWNGKRCGGLYLHVTDPYSFKPFFTTLTILKEVIKTYPGQFSWKPPPYEYEYKRLPIDLIAGSDRIRIALEKGVEPAELEASWKQELDSFREKMKGYLLYHD